MALGRVPSISGEGSHACAGLGKRQILAETLGSFVPTARFPRPWRNSWLAIPGQKDQDFNLRRVGSVPQKEALGHDSFSSSAAEG
jgi:hypothetical protein